MTDSDAGGADDSPLSDREALREQYRDPENLEDRIALHERYSTADEDLNDWRFRLAADRLDRDATVLGLGTGPSRLWRDNRERTPEGWTVHVTDASPGMVAKSRRELSAPWARFAVCDAAALPYRSGTFDAVTAHHMLYHVPERRRALREIRRVLRPGGWLFASTNGDGHMHEVVEVLDAVAGGSVPRATGFRLENGREQLERVFDAVETLPFDDDLRVTEVEPLVRYALSRDSFGPDDAPALHAAFADRFADGRLDVEKTVGMLVARRADGDGGG
jgi:ubiquinone/menaquinone biosynthesis C-methylase UbiE